MSDYIVNVCGDVSRAVFLIKGEKNILFDAGMAYSAKETIENIKKELGGKPVDALILSHSHYDHAAGIPFIKREWPDLTVYGSAYAKHVFEKSSAQETIRGLSDNAAAEAGLPCAPSYRDEELAVDSVVAEGDVLTIGDHTVRVYETPGHTRCSLSYLVDDDVLFASETIGVFAGNWYMPCYLVGYRMALDSLEKLSRVPAKRLFVTHEGICRDTDLPKLFAWIRGRMEQTRDEIEEIIRTWPDDEERQLKEMLRKYHDGVVPEKSQPKMAFSLNAAATLKLVRRECMGEAV